MALTFVQIYNYGDTRAKQLSILNKKLNDLLLHIRIGIYKFHSGDNLEKGLFQWQISILNQIA